MKVGDFPMRDCPGCGARAAKAEMVSDPPAETMTMADLRPYWSGLFREKPFFTYYRCEPCGLLYNRAFFDGAQLADLYSSMAPNMDLVPGPAIAATQRGYFDSALAGGAPVEGGFLEIGPDVGCIVDEAARRGRYDRFWLFEPNRAVHETLRAAAADRPVTLSADMTDLSAVPDASIGLAVMIHVLDHLLDPRAMLAQIRAKLRPDGMILIVTHNERSLLRGLMRWRWPPFCLQHPVLYSPETITRLLTAIGYVAVHVQRSRNVFPLDFLARQAMWAAGLKTQSVPLPRWPVGLRLGNMLTLARAGE